MENENAVTIKFLRIASVMAVWGIVMAGPASSQANRRPPAQPTAQWANTVEARDQGHLFGNPAAQSKLVEYMSYTCSSCGEFARTGDPAIKLLLVPKGTVSFEIRHLFRDQIDLTAALLTHCGSPARFRRNHEAIMLNQATWIAAARKTTQAQRTRWNFGTNAARQRAIASDLGFYSIMQGRGYTRAALDQCLGDEAKATALAEASTRDAAALGLTSTPSFVLDGRVLDGVHSWDALKPIIERLD